MTMTREQASAAVAAATDERDGIQANLLDLDGSFGKRLLAGASLTGETRRRWDDASAELARLWELFTAYSAIVDDAAGLLSLVRRSSSPELTQITALLTGPSVQLTRAPAPLDRRDLTDRGRSALTLAVAVREMKRAFASVAEVVTCAENVWNEISAGLDGVGAALAQARRQAATMVGGEPGGQGLGGDGLGDGLGAALAQAEANLGRLRGVVNSDPLALWQRGQVDTAVLERLREEAAATAGQVAGLARLRDDAQRRIAAVTSAVAAVRAAGLDAMTARDRAAARISAAALPAPPPPLDDLAGRVAGLAGLAAAGRWSRLGAELDLIEKQVATADRQCREAERESEALLRRRDELRGLLDAYQAKAARLGAAEDEDLTMRHNRAHAALWTAPCDLLAAADAVTAYQQAIIALSGHGRQR
jgi:hypothetical protein